METSVDYLVIGAGPAGLQLGYYLKKKALDYVIVERSGSVGHFFEHYPRHRTMISINKLYTGFDDEALNLRWDWNSLLQDLDDQKDWLLFKQFSKDYFPNAQCFVDYMQAFQDNYQLNVQLNHNVTLVSREGEDRFKVVINEGKRVYHAKRVIIGTGLHVPFVPEEIAGIELADQYADVSVNKEDFINKRVLILGKGNSAFETANHLLDTAAVIHISSPR